MDSRFMRYLAIDLGEKRSGLAVGDNQTGIVSPAGVIESGSDEHLMAALLESIEEHRPGALILGLPVNMNGSEGPAAREVRAFGEQLHLRTGLPVYYQDERLTSYAADQTMARTGRTHQQKKALRDALAAAEILRDFFDARQDEDS